MKNAARMAAVAWIFFLSVTLAEAQGVEPYVGFGVGVYTLGIDDSVGPESDEAFGAFLSAGVDIARYLGAEVRLGSTTNEASFPAMLSEIRAEYIISYLGKLQLPFDNGLRLYVLGGGTTAIVYLGSPVSDRIKRTGISFGGGFDYVLSGPLVSDHYRVGVEAMRYWHNVDMPTLPGPFVNPASMTIDAIVATLKYEF